MVKKIKAAQEKLKRRLSGKLFRYTFTFSIALHLGLWGLVSRPRGDAAPTRPTGPEHRIRPEVIISEDKLAPPESIMPETPRPPAGVEPSTWGNPIPVPDKLAEAKTIPDAPPGTNFPKIDPDVKLIVIPGGREVPPPRSASPYYVEIIEVSRPPVVIHQARPVYPSLAYDSGVEGDVVLMVYVDERGDVRNAVVQSSPGLPALEASALKAAYECKFEPARQQGVPVGVWHCIVMEFKL